MSFRRHTDADWRDRLLWALLTGLATAGSAWLANRAAHLAWERVTGRAPPPREGLAAMLGWMAGQKSVGAMTH